MIIPRDALERIVAEMPTSLRRLRGRILLEDFIESIGVGDVPCPGCLGTGWADEADLQLCPLCCGFERVPTRVADWFRSRWKRECQQGARGAYQSAAQRAVELRNPPRGERLGRMALEPVHVHMSCGKYPD